MLGCRKTESFPLRIPTATRYVLFVVLIALWIFRSIVIPSGCDHEDKNQRGNNQETNVESIHRSGLGRADAVFDFRVGRQVVSLSKRIVLADVDELTVPELISGRIAERVRSYNVL